MELAAHVLNGLDRDIDDPNLSLNIETFHLSCRSTDKTEWESEDLGGIVIYSKGSENGVKYSPGYVYVISEKELVARGIQSNQGEIHGRVFKSLFGREFSKWGDSKLLIEGFGRRKC